MTLRLKTQLAELSTSLTDAALARPPVWRRGAVVISVALVVGLMPSRRPPVAQTPEHAVVLSLASEHGLSASPSDVHFIDEPPRFWQPWRPTRAWVLAGAPGAYDDVYLVHTRRSPEGQVLALTELYNLTDTKATGEHHLASYENRAVWLSAAARYLHDESTAAEAKPEFLRLTSARLDVKADLNALNLLQRLQWHVTWWQQYGEWEGVARHNYKLLPVATQAWLTLDANETSLVTENGSSALADSEPTRAEGQHLAHQPTVGTPKPGNLVTWAVDRVRAAPWFGDTNMQRLKAVAYRVWDVAQRRLGVGTSDADDSMSLVETGAEPASNFSQPTLGSPIETPTLAGAAGPSPQGATAIARPWPPAPLKPILSPAEPQEGVWLSLANDPFIKPTTDPQGLFFTTFLRTDPERTFSRIIITTWDPLTVDLHTQSGTEEPKTATGETGTGLVPREGSVVESLVAGFNGGFQATHGDFGMMADGVVYVPPLPYGATVAIDVRGRTGFGTWPADVNGAAAPIPETIRGLRQNLTPLVANATFNPYQRTWWGGVPSGWEDDTRTVRSGICRTKSGLVSYFYGAKVDAENLAKAMLANECEYGLHLDMNQGHTGLEFYHVAPTAELPPLALTLQSMWQAEGTVSETTGLSFRGRRLFRSMQLMNFPRYIQREARDFFYLTARSLLPRRGSKAEVWTVPEHLRHAFPPPMAVRSFSPKGGSPVRLNLLEVDPDFVEPARANDARGLEVLSLSAVPNSTSGGVFWHDGRFVVAREKPSTDALLLLSAQPAAQPLGSLACVHPVTGTLVLAEAATGTLDPSILEKLTAAITALGCKAPLAIVSPVAVSVNGRDLNGHPVETTPSYIRLSYRHPQRSFALFPDTKVVPVSEWKPLQASK